jgi:hypothetical protein
MDNASAWTQRALSACVVASLLASCGGSQSANGSAWSLPQVVARRIAPASHCCPPEILTAASVWLECHRDGRRCRFGTYGKAGGPLRGTFTASGGWFDSLQGCELHESFTIASGVLPLSGTISGFTTRCHSNGLPNSLKYKIGKQDHGTVYIKRIGDRGGFYETFFNFSN